VAGSTLTEGLRGYRDLLVAADVRRVIAWGLVARLPIGMTGLALVLLVRGAGGSYADAGIVSAAEALAAAAGAPVAGRLVDRRPPATVLAGYGVAFPLALLLLVLLAWRDAPLGALIAAAALGGFAFPPVGPTVRMLWPSLVSHEGLRSTAFALEATLQELIFVAGPLVVGALTALVSSSAGIIAAGLLSLVGVLGFIATGPVRDHLHEEHELHHHAHILAALSPPLVRRIVTFSAAYGLTFGAVEVAMPAFAEGHGGRSLGSVALSAWSAGSLAGGLLAAGHRPADPQRRLRVMSVVFAVALTLPLLAGSIPVMTAIMFLVGLPIAPSFALTYGMVQEAALPGTQAEVFGWLSTSVIVGIAAGISLGGNLITHAGSSASLMLGIGGAVIAVAVAAVPVRH
jgi:MFS family permease